jgi:hypothetical protein
MTQAGVFNVNKEVLSQEVQEETAGRCWPSKAVPAQDNGIPVPEGLPVFHRHCYDLARWCSACGPLPPTSFLHVQKTLAERIRPCLENFARELVTVFWTVGHTALYSAFKNGTWRTKYSVLSGQFLESLLGLPRSAGRADVNQIQSTNVTVYAAGPGRHSSSFTDSDGFMVL